MKEPLKEVRRALLEADVSLPVVRRFVKRVEEEVLGMEVTEGVSPEQQLIKAVYDQLKDLMGGEQALLNIGNDVKPTDIAAQGLAKAKAEGYDVVIIDTAGRLQIDEKYDARTQGFEAGRGAALSVKEVSGRPIKFVGTGEKMNAMEPFYPDRMASRILGMGDVVSLVEKAEAAIKEEEAAEMTKKIMSAKFDFNDFLKQYKMVTGWDPCLKLSK
eukprot:jgi/Picre1/31021/NNA_006378.t2